MVDENLIKKVPNPTGRPPRFKTPDELWSKFIEYCEWVDKNPWQLKHAINEVNSRQGGNQNSLRQNVEIRQRAYTLHGFCAFAGICYKWGMFKRGYLDSPDKNKASRFEPVFAQIENVICAQQIDGAMIHEFDSSFVARLNGIADKLEMDGSMTSQFALPKLSFEDIEKLKKMNGL